MFCSRSWMLLAILIISALDLAKPEAPMETKAIRMVNKCPFKIWPAIVGGSMTSMPGESSPPTIALKPGEIYTWKADSFWAGAIWGRTGCVFNAKGLGRCDSGDCMGKLRCGDSDTSRKNMFNTRAEFELLGGVSKPDTYSVTVEHGYNLPMTVVPGVMHGKNERMRLSLPCMAMGCSADPESVCPRNLQQRKGLRVTACMGRFDGFNVSSSPSELTQAFRKACPSAFPFKSGTLCPPSTSSYTLVFCPSNRRARARVPHRPGVHQDDVDSSSQTSP